MSGSAGETIPQIAMYIKESLAGPPPPPPPPTTHTNNNAQIYGPPPQPMTENNYLSGYVGSNPCSVMSSAGPLMGMPTNPTLVMPPVRPSVAPPVIPMQHLPPPPPPPIQNTDCKGTAQPSTSITFSNQVPPAFSINVPPPNLRVAQLQKKTMKRSSSEVEAGPAKLRKEEEDVDCLCDFCKQRILRSNLYKKGMDGMYSNEECQTLVYKKKLEDYISKKELLKSIISPALYRLLEDYLEEGLQYHDLLSQIPTFTQPQHTAIFPRLDNTLLTSLLASTKATPVSNATTSDTFSTYINIMRNVHTSENNINEDKNKVVNEFINYTNGQKKDATIASQNASAVSMLNDMNSAHSSHSSHSSQQISIATPVSTVYNVPPPVNRPYMQQTSLPPIQNPPMAGYSQNNIASTSMNMTHTVQNVHRPPAPNTKCYPYSTLPNQSSYYDHNQ